MAEKIRFLFLAANPVDASYRLRLDEEIREIRKEIRTSPYSDLFEICSEWAVRPKDLQDALVIYKPHIVHLSGHATKAKGIMLEDDSGKICPMSVQAFVDLIRILRGNIRIVFLNLCYTERHVDLLSDLIDYTIGIKTKIGDKGAIVFSSSFYKGLALGLSVRTAFELAVNQLELRRIQFSTSPLLRMREGMTDSESILVSPYQDATTQSPTKSLRDRLDSKVIGSLLDPTRDGKLGTTKKDKTKKAKKRKEKRGHFTKNKDNELHSIIKEMSSDIKKLLEILTRQK